MFNNDFRRAITVVVLLSGLSALPATTTGDITADETWSGTVTITGDVVVRNGTLTISPGTMVKFAETNDNAVYGDSNAISLAVIGQGAIQANGDASNRIVFTTAAATPAKYKWRRIQVLDNAARSQFSYCTVEYGYNGFAVENTGDSVAVAAMGPSSPVIDNCIVTKMSATGIYGSNGTSAQFTNVTIYDCNNGFFFNGAGSVSISHCVVYDVSSGFIFAGDATYTNNVALDHVTMYNVDLMRTTTPQWWTGYGVYTCNDPGTATVTNSIFMMSTLANMIIGSWSVTHDYNCWSTGLYGFQNIGDGQPGPNSVEADPLFTDPTNGDFSLQAGSPAINTASDGTHMGAWQGTVGIGDRAAPREARHLFLLPNPVVKGTPLPFVPAGSMVLKIYRVNGQLVKMVSGQGPDPVNWDRAVLPGMYVYSLQSDNSIQTGTLAVIR